MRGIWQQFRSDLRRATSSVMAVIVLCGLVVIPSAFTWLNVIGSWEPFDNTKNLKVAVASVDEGYTSPLIPLHMNVGSLVESALRANDQLDWVITTKEDAIAGTESGEYYAAMVLPKDFSERMLTFYTAGSKQTQIDYYTNDKSNPLAPLITSEGADDLTAKINSQFMKELSDIALSLVSSIAKNLGSPASEAAFVRIEAHISSVAVQLRAASGTATMFTGILAASVPLVEGGASLLGTVESEFSSATGTVQDGLTAAADADQAIIRASELLAAAFQAGSTQLGEFSSAVDRVFSGLDAGATTTTNSIGVLVDDLGTLIERHEELRARLVEDVQPNLPEEDIPSFEAVLESLDTALAEERDLQARLQQEADAVVQGNADVQQFRSDIDQRIVGAQSALDNAGAVFTNDVKPTLDELAQTLTAVSSGLGGIASDVAGLGSTASGVTEMLTNAATENGELASALGDAADEADRVAGLLSKAIDSGDFGEISKIIGSNPSVLATALSQPIGLDRIPVYPVVSFGAGMAPLYSTLSLWVGALLLCVTLRVAPAERKDDTEPKLQLHQQFLGRYGLFAVLGLMQSTLVFLGNIFIVGLEPVHPFLFMLVGWVTSLVFTFVIYTLVVSFSDAGKALAVFLLVIQVAGAGGAYPLALLPQWFQNVSPFLPGTHSIDAFRAALAGIYQGDYWISVLLLLAFVLPMLLLGLLLRKPLIGVNGKMEKMLQSTKLM